MKTMVKDVAFRSSERGGGSFRKKSCQEGVHEDCSLQCVT